MQCLWCRDCFGYKYYRKDFVSDGPVEFAASYGVVIVAHALSHTQGRAKLFCSASF